MAFAVQPVLGQLALDGGASISGLLGWRYALAAVVLAAIARRSLAAMPRRTAAAAFGLGVVLYAADAAFFYAALERTSAPFATLLHYAHLAVVVGAAAVLGRERLDARRAAALVGVLLGVVLVAAAGRPTRSGSPSRWRRPVVRELHPRLRPAAARHGPDGVRGAADRGAAVAFLVFGSVTGDVVASAGASASWP